MKVYPAAKIVVSALLLGFSAARADVTITGLQHYLVNYQYEPVRTEVYNENQQHFDARVNGRTVGFIIDTGADFTTITGECARRLGLVVQDSGMGSLGAGGAESGTIGLARFARFTIGQVEINQPGPVHVLPGVESIPGADGLFGFNSLWENSAILLVGGDGLLVHPGPRGEGAPLDAYLRGEGFTRVPLTIADSRLLADGTLVGRPLRAEIDCGAATCLFDPAYLKTLNVRTHWYPLGLQGVDGRAVVVREFKSGAMTLGDFSVPPYDMLAGASPLLSRGHFDAVLGFDFLKKHRAVVDFSSGVLWLK